MESGMNNNNISKQKIEILEQVLLSQLSLKNSSNGSVVFLNGPWGCGKTFLWKSRLTKNLTDTLYVSLFGVSKVSELREKIASAIMTGPKDSGFISGGRRLFSRVSFPAALEKWTGVQIKCDILDLIKKRYTICFDDLERLPKESQIEEILGFINHLAEHLNFRCLIIFNEAEIKDVHKAHFHALKEKLSLRTYELPFDLKGLTKEVLISQAKEQNIDLGEGEILDFVSMIVDYNISNFRIITFTIECYLEARKISGRKIPAEATNFLVALVANEALTQSHEWDFYNFNSMEIEFRNYHKNKKKEDGKNEPDPQADFYEKYFGRSQSYRPYNAIYRLFKYGLIAPGELNSELFPEANKLSPAQKLAQQIRDTHFFFMSDQNLQDLVVSILEFRDNAIEDFATFYTLMKGYSSAMTLLEKETELVLPSEFIPRLKIILQNESNIDEIVGSLTYNRDDIAKAVSDSIYHIAIEEQIQRKKKYLEKTITNGFSSDFKEIFLESPDILQTIFTDGSYLNLYKSQSISEQDRYRLLETINKAAFRNSINEKISAELDKISLFLNGEYASETSKMGRLRIYRLIEATQRNIPEDHPKVVRKTLG